VLKELDEFREHVNRVHTQHAANDRLKKNLPVGECTVQMDFSENYTCQNMDEIQSVNWTNASITLHPVACYNWYSEEGTGWVHSPPTLRPIPGCTKCNSLPTNGQCTNHHIAV